MKYIIFDNFTRKNYFDSKSMIIEKNKLYFLVGKNGSGKSSILKLISGRLNKRMKDEGIYIKKTKSISCSIEVENLPLNINAYDILSLYKDYDFDYLKLFDLENKKIDKMSMGMKQKLAIILSISQNKRVYLLDEVDNYLDDYSFIILKKVLEAYIKKGKTIIIATHNILKYQDLEGVIWNLD